MPTADPSKALIRRARAVCRELEVLQFGPPVTHVYNPLMHAWRGYARYLEKYANSRKQIVLLGMNPGPFGMVQTGVPFGEVSLVRDWLDIEEKVDRPADEHPKRPVLGFECTRSEISGHRLWTWCRDRFGTPHRFFRRFFVHNYCPLAFMEESGRNLTPDKLPVSEQRLLFEICDRYLRDTVAILSPELVVGIGAFAEKRARATLGSHGARIGRIPHPSPASPAANRGWAAAADAAFAALGVEAG